MYTGKRYQLFDGKGNIVEQYDTRILEEEIKLNLQELDKDFTDNYHVKLGFDELQKEKANRKILEARQGLLSDKKETQELLLKDKELKEEYRLRKEMILNAKDCDECNDAVYKPKKLVKVSKYLGLSSELKLEDITSVD